MTYSLHHELTDGTLEPAFITYPAKRTALRVAKIIARKPAFAVVRIIVNNAEELTVAAFDVPQADQTKIIGRVGRDPRRDDRWTLYRADGSVSNRFARDASRQDVAAVLEQNGMRLRDDNQVEQS